MAMVIDAGSDCADRFNTLFDVPDRAMLRVTHGCCTKSALTGG